MYTQGQVTGVTPSVGQTRAYLLACDTAVVFGVFLSRNSLEELPSSAAAAA